MRRWGDRQRITAQLINVADGLHLWSERYNRRLEDVFAIQEEVALAIAPNHWLPHWVSAMQAFGVAHLDKARSEAEKAVELSGGVSMAVTVLACVCQALGDARRVGELDEGLRDRARRGHVAPTAFAWIADARRDVPAALRWLEHAAATQDPMVCFYRTMPARLLSGDPAIESMLRRFDL